MDIVSVFDGGAKAPAAAPAAAKAESKVSLMEVVSKAAKQAKIDDEDLEEEEKQRKEGRIGDYLHDFTAHEGHSHVVFCVSFSPNGDLLLSGSGDKTVKLWDLQSCKVLTTFIEHEQWVYSVCFMHHSMGFATACDDGRVRIFENDTEPVNHETGWKLICDLGKGGKHDPANGHDSGVLSVDVSKDDSYVVSASADMKIKVWRRLEKECFLTLRGHNDWVTRARFDNDGLWVVSSSYDKHAKLWRMSDGECTFGGGTKGTFYGHESWVSDVAWSPECRNIATASGDFTVRLWQVKVSGGASRLILSRSLSPSLSLEPKPKQVKKVVDGKEVLCADGMPLCIFYGHKNWVLSVNFSANGLKLCSGSADCSCIVWDILERKVKQRIKHNEWVEHAAFAPDQAEGGQLAACGHEVDIRLWNVTREEPEIIAVLPSKVSYLGMLFYWLRSLIYGDSWKSPPLSHQRHHALRMLFNRLDPYESDRVAVSDLVEQMGKEPLLQVLLEQPENGADLMHHRFPRTVMQALTHWQLSGDSHISWRPLLQLFMDPDVERSTDDSELDHSSLMTRVIRRSMGVSRASIYGGGTSIVRKSRRTRGSASASDSASSEDDDLSRATAFTRVSMASSSRGDEEEEDGEADESASKTVELMRTPRDWGLELDSQHRVLAVKPGSQAARGDSFAVGDQLLSLNGEPLSGGATLSEQLGAFAVGTKVAVEVRTTPRGAAKAGSSSLDAQLSSKAKGKQPVPSG